MTRWVRPASLAFWRISAKGVTPAFSGSVTASQAKCEEFAAISVSFEALTRSSAVASGNP